MFCAAYTKVRGSQASQGDVKQKSASEKGDGQEGWTTSDVHMYIWGKGGRGWPCRLMIACVSSHGAQKGCFLSADGLSKAA